MSRSFRRGFNAALRAVRQRVQGASATGIYSAEERDVLASVAETCRQMRQPTRHKPRLAAFAARYAISLRTVKNWKRAGCPFARGHRAILGWMFRRRTLPAGPRRKFAREFAEMAFADAAKAALQSGMGMSPTADDGARLLLSHRINSALEAAGEMEGKQLLKRSAAARVRSLTKVAERAGLWQ